jgi:hypothetical protein
MMGHRPDQHVSRRWYVENAPVADRLYDEHLEILKLERKG